ncbi:MAG: hypothetical protein N3E40_02385, partial [Dehalococcoidia bacterium]|nr:hypothetical protein [Dehalococcoidia bacterium]
LKDRPRTPHHQPRKTPSWAEDKGIEIKCKTRYGPERLSRYLRQHEGVAVPPGTIRHIIRSVTGNIKIAKIAKIKLATFEENMVSYEENDIIGGQKESGNFG